LATLDTLLTDIASELRRFVAVLAEEKAALIAGEAHRLPALTTEKSALAERLATLDSQRNSALQAQGFAPGRQGIDSWLAKQSVANATLWREILMLAAQAKQANEINGALIGTQSQQNQQALSVLLGEFTATYDASGQQQPLSGGRPLGSA
jgi:flagella synthesis protein FlgN